MAGFAESLNEQIAYEYAASQQYVAIAVHYDAESLPQLAAHFYRQAVEERNHAMMMVQFLLDADEAVDIPRSRGAEDGLRRRARARRARAGAGEAGHRPDRRARRAGTGGREARRRAVPALVPPGAARGGLVDVAPARHHGAGGRQPAPRRGDPRPDRRPTRARSRPAPLPPPAARSSFSPRTGATRRGRPSARRLRAPRTRAPSRRRGP